MDTFPTLYRHGTVKHTPVVGELQEELAFDPTIRSQSEGGYVTSRARFTRRPRKWTVRYTWMSRANKNSVRVFEDAQGAGAEYFTWTNPSDNIIYVVRFTGPVKYTPEENSDYLWWQVEFTMEQV